MIERTARRVGLVPTQFAEQQAKTIQDELSGVPSAPKQLPASAPPKPSQKQATPPPQQQQQVRAHQPSMIPGFADDGYLRKDK